MTKIKDIYSLHCPTISDTFLEGIDSIEEIREVEALLEVNCVNFVFILM